MFDIFKKLALPERRNVYFRKPNQNLFEFEQEVLKRFTLTTNEQSIYVDTVFNAVYWEDFTQDDPTVFNFVLKSIEESSERSRGDTFCDTQDLSREMIRSKYAFLYNLSYLKKLPYIISMKEDDVYRISYIEYTKYMFKKLCDLRFIGDLNLFNFEFEDVNNYYKPSLEEYIYMVKNSLISTLKFKYLKPIYNIRNIEIVFPNLPLEIVRLHQDLIIQHNEIIEQNNLIVEENVEVIDNGFAGGFVRRLIGFFEGIRNALRPN